MPAIHVHERRTVAPATRRRLQGPILLATDGTPQSTGAFAAAVCIAAGGTRRGDIAAKLPVRVVTVCAALPIAPPEVPLTLPLDYVQGRRAEMLADALAQVRYNVADASKWRVEVVTGAPAPTIADLADDVGASLVVMGLGKHALADRVFGSETALKVMQRSRVPVLAVPQNWIGIPRRVLIAADFGPASIRAARTAMRFVAPGSTVCVAHVAPNIGLPDMDPTLAEIYHNSLSEQFDAFMKAVGIPADVIVTRKALYGDASKAILEYANANDVDMIVAGTHGHGAFARLFVGSVASAIVRGAHCAVLVATASESGDDGGDTCE